MLEGSVGDGPGSVERPTVMSAGTPRNGLLKESLSGRAAAVSAMGLGGGVFTDLPANGAMVG